MAAGRMLGTTLGGALAAGAIVAGLGIAGLLLADWRGLGASPIERVLGAVAQRSVKIAGPVRIALQLRGPVLIVHDLTLANADWASGPSMLAVGCAEIRLSLLPLLTHEARIQSVALSDVRMSVETDAKGRTNRPDISRTPTRSLLGFEVTGPQSLSARNLIVSYQGAPGLTPSTLVLSEAYLTRAEDGAHVEAHGTFRAVKVSLSARVNNPAALLSDQGSPLEATVAIDDTTMLVKGTLADPDRGLDLHLKLDGEGPSLRNLGALLGVDDLPEEGRLTFALELSLSREGLAISDLSASLGSGSLAGSVTARQRNDGGIDAEVVLASDRLDLEPLQGNWGKLVDLPKLWSVPIPVDVWRTSHVDLTYQAGAVTYRDLELTDVDARALLQGGALHLYPFAFNLDDVPVEAELSLDLQKPKPEGKLRIDTRRAPIGKALATSGALVGLEGPLDLSVDLAGKGDSLKEISATLTGTVDARLGPGKVEPKLLGTLPSPLRGTWATWAKGTAASGSDVPIDCATVAFKFAKGRSNPSDVTLVSGQIQLAGEGVLDLASDRVALLLSAEPRQESAWKALTPGYTVQLEGSIRSPELGLTAFKPIPVKPPKSCALATPSRVPRIAASANEP